MELMVHDGMRVDEIPLVTGFLSVGGEYGAMCNVLSLLLPTCFNSRPILSPQFMICQGIQKNTCPGQPHAGLHELMERSRAHCSRR